MSDDAAPVRVHLLGLPLRRRAAFLQHVDGLLRELALVQLEAEQDAETSLPPRLLHVASELRTHYAPFQAQPAAVMEAALAAGEDFCDVTYALPRQILSFVQRLEELLEEADDFCRREQHLLMLPASPEVVAYRRWVFGELQRQLAGQARGLGTCLTPALQMRSGPDPQQP